MLLIFKNYQVFSLIRHYPKGWPDKINFFQKNVGKINKPRGGISMTGSLQLVNASNTYRTDFH